MIGLKEKTIWSNKIYKCRIAILLSVLSYLVNFSIQKVTWSTSILKRDMKLVYVLSHWKKKNQWRRHSLDRNNNIKKSKNKTKIACVGGGDINLQWHYIITLHSSNFWDLSHTSWSLWGTSTVSWLMTHGFLLYSLYKVNDKEKKQRLMLYIPNTH